MRKKIDNRIRVLIENGVKLRHRTFFVLVGDKGKDQVVNLYYMLTKARTTKLRPSVLWCYKKELGFSSHRKKRMKEIKKKQRKGVYDPETDDPFELFISSTDIRYTYYKESHKILGNTYGVLVLQDFEALTPNLLARTIETVEGGGLVILLLRTMSSLKQLYEMTMDVHARLRTESHHDVVGRFNERFILSLGACKRCLVLDDELNILPISSHCRSIVPVSPHEVPREGESAHEQELKQLKQSLKDTEPVYSLVNTARTLDQAKSILTFIEAISEKTLRSTVALTAARGRGKSAALGIAIAAAVGYGYSNIFVTSPSPENLNTLFTFVFKGFDALGYREHADYELVQSTNPEFHNAIVRVNIFREHRQTIQYIRPQDSAKLGQAELVVIDEAAAIPLPLVRSLIGPYLVFMASTVNGYEGTGRSLSLKLLEQLRRQSGVGASSARVLREISLDEPIRYSPGDPVERWLHDLLCLDATAAIPRSTLSTLGGSCPHPDQCELYYVNRDTLFSFHRESEVFLQRMVALFVASHYKNSPNDLLLMSDAPAHHLFVLLGPAAEMSAASTLPDILCAVQVALEGAISKESVKAALAKGIKESGDLVPWTISQQFQDDDFPALSGARIVRIATHPDFQRMGYGSRALALLGRYYQGDIVNLSEAADDMVAMETAANGHTNGGSEDGAANNAVTVDGESTLQTEQLRPRSGLPPLLTRLEDRKAERLHWLGVSYGLTSELLRFWQRAGFEPVYVRLTTNDLTGEHSCIMLKALRADDEALDVTVAPDWLSNFAADFKRRFLSLLSYDFRAFSTALALKVLFGENDALPRTDPLTFNELSREFTAFDLKRLHAYANGYVDYHVMIDLLPALSRLFFSGKFPTIHLPSAQLAILLGMGLQHRSLDDLVAEMGLPQNQILAFFHKAIKKLAHEVRSLQEKHVEESLPEALRAAPEDIVVNPQTTVSLEEDLEEAAQETKQQLDSERQALIDSLDLREYAIGGSEADWNDALSRAEKKGLKGVISIKKQMKAAKAMLAAQAGTTQRHHKRKAGKDKARKGGAKRMKTH